MLANELMIWKSKRTNLYAFKVSHLFFKFVVFLEQVEEKNAKKEKQQQQRSNIGRPFAPTAATQAHF